MGEIRGRNALLTGAGGGLGGYIADELARAGANVVLTDVPGVALDDLAARLRGHRVRAETLTADLSDGSDVDALAGRAEAALGPIDILVNNAGIEITSGYARFTPEEIERIAAVNLVAPMRLVRAALPGMASRGRGHVVCMSSLAGKIGFPHCAPYAATKAGLIALVQSLRLEYGGSGVGFSAICPGLVSDVGIAHRALGGVNPPRLLAAVAPEKVARAVVRAIREDRPQMLVTATPVRPVLALAEVFPRFGERFIRFTGFPRVARDMARRRNRD